MYNRLSDFLTKLKIIYEYQFGFWAGHSASQALVCLAYQIISAYEKKKIVLGLFLDVSKAFDTVNHRILLKKLDHNGIRSSASSWLSSYLSSRKQ